jgi:hypothetical protein
LLPLVVEFDITELLVVEEFVPVLEVVRLLDDVELFEPSEETSDSE